MKSSKFFEFSSIGKFIQTNLRIECDSKRSLQNCRRKKSRISASTRAKEYNMLLLYFFMTTDRLDNLYCQMNAGFMFIAVIPAQLEAFVFINHGIVNA